MSLNLDNVQKLFDEDSELIRVVLALDGVGAGFGITEAEIVKRTGMESQVVLKHLERLQHHGIIELRCTQVGTSGPYDYFFRFVPGIKMQVSITRTEPLK